MGVCDNVTVALLLFLIPACFNDTVYLLLLLKCYIIQGVGQEGEGPWVIYVSSARCLKFPKWRGVIWEVILLKVRDTVSGGKAGGCLAQAHTEGPELPATRLGQVVRGL